jgi:hypothetical protein
MPAGGKGSTVIGVLAVTGAAPPVRLAAEPVVLVLVALVAVVTEKGMTSPVAVLT